MNVKLTNQDIADWPSLFLHLFLRIAKSSHHIVRLGIAVETPPLPNAQVTGSELRFARH